MAGLNRAVGTISEDWSMAEKELFPEVEQIISIINRDERQDIVILVIPSHYKEGKADKPLKDQEIWAGNAMELFADLYRGGTAFQTFKGIYKDTDGEVHHDKPILIESYVERSRLVDEATLQQLLAFAKRMGRETRQKAVALIINDVFHEITEF
jgi:hypothetical protein